MLLKFLVVLTVVLLCSSIHGKPSTSLEDSQIANDLLNQINDEVIDGSDIIDLSHLDKSLFGEPDEKVGEILNNWKPEDGGNPEEQGTYLEGDMLITKPEGRNGLIDVSKRWTNGIIPFRIEGSFNAIQMQMIENAINEYHRKTCIRWKPHSGERDYVVFQSQTTGCWASVGNVGGRQEINLQIPGCVTKIGTVVHEMMHTVGFLHEQNRYERDDYVTINYNNIKPDTKGNFYKADSKTVSGFGVNYDYGSVMHYSGTAFSTNGLPTIVPKMAVRELGQRDGFSMGDIVKINSMYGCVPLPGNKYPNGIITNPNPNPYPYPYPEPTHGAYPPGYYPQPLYPAPGYYENGYYPNGYYPNSNNLYGYAQGNGYHPLPYDTAAEPVAIKDQIPKMTHADEEEYIQES